MLDKLIGKLKMDDSDDAKPDRDAVQLAIIETLRGIYDPEIPVNVYDLGLIYKVELDDDMNAAVDMTLTTPGCPVAQTFPGMIENAVAQTPGVNSAEVELVWDPPWSPDILSDEVKLQLGIL